MKREYDEIEGGEAMKDNEAGSEEMAADGAKAPDIKGQAEAQELQIVIEDRTEYGFDKSCQVSGTSYSGEQMKDMLGLASTNFYVEDKEGGVRIVCLGSGNCLGVSQFGSNRMADKGAAWRISLDIIIKMSIYLIIDIGDRLMI